VRMLATDWAPVIVQMRAPSITVAFYFAF
jgi:hypothetical protein